MFSEPFSCHWFLQDKLGSGTWTLPHNDSYRVKVLTLVYLLVFCSNQAGFHHLGSVKHLQQFPKITSEKCKFITRGFYASIYKMTLVNQENIDNLKMKCCKRFAWNWSKILTITINVASPWVHLSTISCHLPLL